MLAATIERQLIKFVIGYLQMLYFERLNVVDVIAKGKNAEKDVIEIYRERGGENGRQKHRKDECE